jgi:hypothetical protein
LFWTGGALLLRDDMVEKAVAVAVREVTEFERGVRRAIGLTALLRTLDR